MAGIDFDRDLVRYLMKRFADLRARRANFDNTWNDIADFIIPHRGQFNTKITPGERLDRKILDSTGSWAAEQLANFMYGAMTNPGSRWFGISTFDQELARNREAQAYLQFSTEHLYGVFNNPMRKFYDNAHEMYMDVTPFGTGIQVLENRPGIGLTFKTRFLAECYLDENSDSRVDTMFRFFQMDLRQIVQEFGLNALPPELQRSAEKDQGRRMDILHCIYPRVDNISISSKGKPWASQYILHEKSSLLREGGFDQFPVLAPRWTKRSDSVYGYGPGWFALAEIRMLNKMKETTLIGAQLTVAPPMQAPDGSFMAPMDFTPAAMNWSSLLADGGRGVEPIITNARPELGLEMMREEKEAILRNFYVDKLSSQKGQNVEQTRAEFLGEQQERLLLLAPQLGRFHTEYLGPLIERTYLSERASGHIPPPPDILKGQPLVIQYFSPLARAQQLQKLAEIDAGVQQAAAAAQIFPEIMDAIIPDAYGRHVFLAHNTPMDVLRPQDQIEEIRQQREEQQQLQQQMDTAQQGSEVAKNVAQIDPGGNKRAIA